MGFIAGHLVENGGDEIKSLQRLFDELDDNNDGLLSIEEVASAIHGNVKESVNNKDLESLEKAVKEVDSDGSGMIDIDEFIQAAMQQALYLKESSVSAAFERFDVDGKGSISKADLEAVFGAESAEKILKEADLNNDGVIDYKEFAIAVRNKEKEDHLRPKSVGRVAKTLRREEKM